MYLEGAIEQLKATGQVRACSKSLARPSRKLQNTIFALKSACSFLEGRTLNMPWAQRLLLLPASEQLWYNGVVDEDDKGGPNQVGFAAYGTATPFC